MKKYISFFSVILLVAITGSLSPCYGQWQKFVIDDDVSRAVSVDVADLNYDGKKDILVTNFDDAELVLYLNNYPFWTRHVIATGSITFAYIGDMDNNDTLDIVACNIGSQQICWYENKHPTWPEHIIDANTDDADYIQVADIDGDNTLDVVTGGYGDGHDIIWYENNSTAWVEHIIEDDASKAPVLDVNDIDGDGVQDILVVLKSDKKIVWYKTEDKGITWTENVIDENFNNAWSAFSADIDADNDVDIVATNGGPYGGGGKDVVWYENNNLEWTKHTVDNALDGANIVQVGDVDGDATADIIATGFVGDDVVWYKIDDEGLNWDKYIIDDNMEGPRLFYYTDIDGDQVKDLIVAGTNNVVLYKNPNTPVPYLMSSEVFPRNTLPQQVDSITIIGKMINPEDHPVRVFAVIEGEQSDYVDTLQLFDDGLHSDTAAFDSWWGNILMTEGLEEDSYKVELVSYDSTSEIKMSFPQGFRFITFGPVAYEDFTISSSNVEFKRDQVSYIKVTLVNNSTSAIATNIKAKISCQNPDIIITDGFNAFPDIAAGETAQSPIFKIYVTENCPLDTPIPILVDIAFEDNICWTESFPIIVTVGINEVTRNPKIKIYPNPSNDLLNIEANNFDNYSVEIFSLSGQQIYSTSMEGSSMQIDLSPFNKGIYFITVRSNEFVRTEKLLKL